jgi:hypothetical protein
MICVSTVSTKPYPIAPLIHLQWLVMPDNLVFMGLHFVIGKCKQRPTNIIAVQIDEYHLLIFQYTPTPSLSRTCNHPLPNPHFSKCPNMFEIFW